MTPGRHCRLQASLGGLRELTRTPAYAELLCEPPYDLGSSFFCLITHLSSLLSRDLWFLVTGRDSGRTVFRDRPSGIK